MLTLARKPIELTKSGNTGQFAAIGGRPTVADVRDVQP